MIKQLVSKWTVIVSICFLTCAELKAWVIEHIKNDLPYEIRVEFVQIDNEDSLISLDIAPGSVMPFGQACPFEQDLKKGFGDFENLSATLSIAPRSHPLCKGFIAEGVYDNKWRLPATFYYEEGSPTPRLYIINPTLGLMRIRADSCDMYATLRLFEKECISRKKGTRKRMFCELIAQKYLLPDGSFTSNLSDRAE